jgi:hypothetical protein
MKVPIPGMLVVLCCAAVCSAAGRAELKAGKADLRSAGPLAFGPDGILFAGDSAGGAVFAIDTGDRKAASGGSIEIKGINEKVAALLGATPDQILIQDVAVNPISRNVYLSVSRGRGPDAAAVILRVDASGKLSELSLENVKHSRVSLPDAPAADAKDGRGQSRRVETITDLGFVGGKVIVAGLSNEEFSSSLRSIPYPFTEADKGAGIEIYHGSHGRFETNAPVRTFVPYTVAGTPHILAAYTCTPLVTIPVSELKPGNKVKGTTIAELGNRNRPLDMIVYQKDGKDFILMANSSRGVMKLPAAKLDSYAAITAHTEKQGVPYETLSQFQGVQQLDKFNDQNALMLVADGGTMTLRTVALP